MYCQIPTRALRFSFLLFVTSGALAAIDPCIADIRLPGAFSDKMVLQQGENVRIWGTAAPNEVLEISLGENRVSATADAAGQWSTQIAPPPVGGPYELAIAGADARVVFTDVLVGEVWLCSGQSNMEWSVGQSIELADPAEIEQYLGTLLDSNLRLLTVPRSALEEPVSSFSEAANWQSCTPDVVRDFSAVAFYFARALRNDKKLRDVPIGLIDSSWGGTPAEAWTSRSALEKHESLKPLLVHWDENTSKNVPHRPGNLFNGMIAPIIPLSIRGVIWYQGESNVGRGEQYATIMPALIEDWRERFGQGDIPFYMVQLAPFRYGDKDPTALAELWDAQRRTLALPNVAMSGSSDIGNPANIHPNNKEQVGRRLALLARHLDYGDEQTVCSGPTFKSVERVTGTPQMIVAFDFADGLMSKADSPGGFLVCGEDRNFVPAEAKIENGKVLVWSDDVAEPVAVRYLWDDTAVCDLFNGAGLPAFPFRSDSFELKSKDVAF
jgi:sialate O-acetylesterase